MHMWCRIKTMTKKLIQFVAVPILLSGVLVLHLISLQESDNQSTLFEQHLSETIESPVVDVRLSLKARTVKVTNIDDLRHDIDTRNSEALSINGVRVY